MNELRTDFVGMATWQTLARYRSLVIIYVLATAFTSPLIVGDTSIYVDAILRVANGGSTRFWDEGGFLSFWEFGHLLWRPLGWISFRLAHPLLSATLDFGARASVTVSLIALNWLFGLLAVVSLAALLKHLSIKPWAILITTIGFMFSNAFLNFSQSGCSYVPGLALLLLAFYLLLRAGSGSTHATWTAVTGGLVLAGAVGLWLPYLYAVPAALASQVVLYGASRQRLRTIAWATTSCALAIVLMYGSAMAVLGLGDLSSMSGWAAASAHEVTENRGLSRVLFGVPRSLVNMGTESVFYKRFLTGDPFNRVTFLDLARASLWKLGFAYLFLASIGLALVRSPDGRRVFFLLLLNAVPVAAFAVYFAGGVLERYLPVFPLLFVSVGFTLSMRQAAWWLKLTPILFLSVVSLINAVAISHALVRRERDATIARVHELNPLLGHGSRVFVPPQDELWGSAGRLGLDRASPLGQFHVDPIAILGTASVPNWKKEFAIHTLTAWASEKDVWISKRLVAPRPKPEWNWTEGEDPRIGWSDLYLFFAQFETGKRVGGEDGFLLLAPSPNNRSLLSEIALATDPRGPNPRPRHAAHG